MEDGEDDAVDACDIDKTTIGATAAPNFEKAQRLGRTGEDELKGSEYRQCECPRTPRWFYYQASPVRMFLSFFRLSILAFEVGDCPAPRWPRRIRIVLTQDHST